MKQFSIFLIALLSLTTAFAQNKYTITGTMADSLSHDKIFYATIGLLTSDSNARMVGNTYTDATGNFTLSDIPAGTYNLKASLVGYDLLTMPVTVGGGQKTINLGELQMKKVSNNLQEVTIKGEKPVYLIDGEKTLYNVSEDPTIQSGTASDALQNAPGVEVDVEGNITLRGVSSVEIWLNNKPSNMNEEALKQFIQQMPAGTIEKIEVITNPSARYSAKGGGGIINIVTTSKIKKNSFLSFGARGSSSPDISPFLSYVYANEKFSISAYAHYSYGISKGTTESSETLFSDAGDTSSIYNTSSYYKSPNHQFGLYLNGNYTPDTMNTFSFWAGCYPRLHNSISNAQVSRIEYIDNPGDYSYVESMFQDGLSASGGGYGGMWFEHKFNSKGHKISADISLNGYGSKYLNYDNRDYLAEELLDRYKINNNHYSNFGVNASIDYTVPYHKDGEIELGVSGGYDRGYYLNRIDTMIFGTSEYTTDWLRSKESLSNDGDFEAYATIQHRFGNFTIKGGLRTEYEKYNLTMINETIGDVNKGYWGFYPSLHLSYRTKSMHNFKLSYARRVSNPSGDDLSAYCDYGEDGFSTGNPDLRQAFTNSVEAGWSKFFMKFGNVGLNAYFRNTKDEFSTMTDVVYDPVFGRIVTFSKPLNAGKSLNTGAELNVMYRLKSFMNIRFYANMYYSKSEFMFRDEETPRTVDNLGYSFRLNFWAKAWNFLEINASANYHSKSVTMFSISQPRYSIDCGLRAEFWKKRIAVSLNVNDIFNWNTWSSASNNPYYISSSVSRNSWMGRSIRASISFKFGKMELESQASQGGGGMQPQGM